jgi:uncharacterized protein (TIGR02246 family)
MVSLLLLMTALSFARSQGNKPPMSKAEQEISRLNQRWADAIAHGDMKTLEGLFSEDFVLTTGDGMLRSKKEELEDLKPGADLKTYFFNLEDVRVKVYKDSAVVTGHAKWRINVKGRDSDIERRYTSVFVKQNGRWQIVAQHLSRIAK